MKTLSRCAGPALLVAVVAMACACAKKGVKKPLDDTRTPASRRQEADIRGPGFVGIPELKTVRFEFDRYSLGQEARAVITANAEAIGRNPDWEVLVEGHCDERGTTEYNLALGQNRARAVREFYLLLGVPGRKVGTISYGDQNPLCREPGEDCWEQNRRADHKVRVAR